MSRPRKKPSIVEQMQALIAQAIESKLYGLAKDLTNLLEQTESPVPLKAPKEGE